MLGLEFCERSSEVSKEVLEEAKGIIPRSIAHILDHVKRNCYKTKYSLYCSYLEIYNEKIYDLLDTSPIEHERKLEIREDKQKGLFVEGLTSIHVTNEEDI